MKRTYLFDRTCKNCALPFWHLDASIEYCGDRDCNLKDLDKKTCVLSGDLSYPQFFEAFRSYYSKNYSFCDSAIVLDRCSTNSKISGTNMNFISAGISSYETLLDELNPRLKFFSNKLLVSTPFCYRFNDLENVGTTQRHNTGFFMFSLHCFESIKTRFPEDWRQQFLDLFVNYFTSNKIGLDKIYLHKDVWSDGVNSGSCVEAFINGIQMGNMVFITEQNGAPRKLRLLDVGLGGQRIHKLLARVDNGYSTDIIKDHVRALIIAFKDGLYPCKTGAGYCIRKILEYLYSKGYDSVEKIKPVSDEIFKDLIPATKEPFDTFLRDFKEITVVELPRYLKAVN